MSDRDQPEIVRNDERGRFELAEEPGKGYLDFRLAEGQLTLTYTEVSDDLEGQGVGGALVRSALDHAEAEGLTIVPECGFVASWLDRHPDRAAELDVATP